ncbi:hypothetical protein KAU45_03890 [bacterium]|nr:hypothetical protein [bacterium]
MLTFDIAHRTDSSKKPEQKHYDAAAKAAKKYGLIDKWTDTDEITHECPHNTFVGTTKEGTGATTITEAVRNAVKAEDGNFTVPRAYCLVAEAEHWDAGGHG